METTKRIRLLFRDDDILSASQKSDGLNRSWVLLKPHQHDTLSDVASHLLDAFQLRQSCPHGLLLSVSGYVLPPFESTCILKDNEIISVKKRRDNLSLEGNNVTGEVGKLKAVEKQPVDGSILLLANEEFNEEKGGYESDESEEEDEDLSKDIENPACETVDPTHRKRKAAEKLQGSKKKKQRAEASECDANKLHTKKKQRAEASECDANKLHTENARDESRKNGPSAEHNVEEEGTKSSDQNNDSVAGMKRNDEAKGDDKENGDAKKDPKEHKRLRSRNARRKSVKRQWLKEMRKIQMQNMNCESESLRNWKEDQAKAKKQVEKGLKKWEKQQGGIEKNGDGQAKGLLHWMQSPQDNTFVKGKKRGRQDQNAYFSKHSSQNKDNHEKQSDKNDGHELSKQHKGNVPEQLGQASGVHEDSTKYSNAYVQLNDNGDKQNEVVPVVIRPGHIRFETLDEDDANSERAVQKEYVTLETFQWNGITSKKKGQKWGKENHSFTQRNDVRNSEQVHSEAVSNGKQKEQVKEQVKEVDFDKLPPLTTIPKEGDLIAYRILELSSSWTPELSAFRVGKVSWFDAESNQTLLIPVSGYPIVLDKGNEDESDKPNSDSLYKGDGSLEIDFSSLIDARIFNNGGSVSGNELRGSECSAGNENTLETVLPGGNDAQTVALDPETVVESGQQKETELPPSDGDVTSTWEQISKALATKKEQLSKENGWGMTPKKVQPIQETNWRKDAQPSPKSNCGKNARNAHWGKNDRNVQKPQPSKDNSWGQQSSGTKSWSYKALRGSALGPTMAMLRSKNDA